MVNLQSLLLFRQVKDNKSLDEKDTNGEEILAVFNPMIRADWKLAGVVPTDELVKEARPILLTTLLRLLARLF